MNSFGDILRFLTSQSRNPEHLVHFFQLWRKELVGCGIKISLTSDTTSIVTPNHSLIQITRETVIINLEKPLDLEDEKFRRIVRALFNGGISMGAITWKLCTQDWAREADTYIEAYQNGEWLCRVLITKSYIDMQEFTNSAISNSYPFKLIAV